MIIRYRKENFPPGLGKVFPSVGKVSPAGYTYTIVELNRSINIIMKNPSLRNQNSKSTPKCKFWFSKSLTLIKRFLRMIYHYRLSHLMRGRNKSQQI